MEKSLLVDTLSFDISPDVVNESINNGKQLLVSGILQRANAKNFNGRIYPSDILKREVDKYHTHCVKERRAMGELDHNDSNVVNLNNVSHNIVDLKWEGDNLVGRIEILSTPSGNILKELFKSGIKLGISSRGLGSLKKDNEGNDIVQEDYDLICWDFVSSPSVPGAYVFPDMLNEGKNNNNKYDKINKIIREILIG